MNKVHLLLYDGSRTVCREMGSVTSFPALVTCETCANWHEANELAKPDSLNFHEELTALDDRPECEVCPARLNADDVTWINGKPVCPVHADSYREMEGKQ